MAEVDTQEHALLDALDEVVRLHDELVGDKPAPGLDHNKAAVADHVDNLRRLAQNTLELKAEYDKGVTHAQRVRRSTGMEDTDDMSDRVKELERQLAEARGNV